MSNTQATYLIVGVAGALSLAAWVGLIVVPAWTSYARVWERLAALVLSVYVLLAILLAGAAIGGLVLFYYDRL